MSTTQPSHSKTILERASVSSSQQQQQGQPSRRQQQVSSKIDDTNNVILPQSIYDEEYHEAPINQGLLNHKRKSMRDSLHIYYKNSALEDNNNNNNYHHREWMRPYWLGTSLGLLLFAFWILDSLKDPLFAQLVHGHIETHQPNAKLCSVAWTLILVCGLEYLANQRRRSQNNNNNDSRQEQHEETQQDQHELLSKDQVLDGGGVWNIAPVYSSQEYRQEQRRHRNKAADDTISISIFYEIGIAYGIAFVVIAHFVQLFQTTVVIRDNHRQDEQDGWDRWYILAYVLHATIESFGSIAVATFWSFTNSTLALDDAERYYGPIIALAQLGAIGGSTMVAKGLWDIPVLLQVVSLVITLQWLVMIVYHRRFPPSSVLAVTNDDDQSIWTWQDNNDATLTKPFWSGVHLIFQHSYVLLILGVSCLYEISLTCLDYQMKLLGYAHFAMNEATALEGSSNPLSLMASMSFAEFMGRYGQAVNLISLIFSSLLFPRLIRRYGLRWTLRLFPSLLVIVTLITYVALPGNLTVLFVSLSLLKAMTYSIHDPSKELLYIPTSNAIKFRAKFWIDVVGERISKAMGGVLNHVSGSVEQSIKVGSFPSLITAAGLWMVCWYVGQEFDRLIHTGTIVGLEEELFLDRARTYQALPKNEPPHEDHGGDDDDNYDPTTTTTPTSLDSVEILFVHDSNDDECQSLSTLGFLDSCLEEDNARGDVLAMKTIPPMIVRL